MKTLIQRLRDRRICAGLPGTVKNRMGCASPDDKLRSRREMQRLLACWDPQAGGGNLETAGWRNGPEVIERAAFAEQVHGTSSRGASPAWRGERGQQRSEDKQEFRGPVGSARSAKEQGRARGPGP